MSGYTLEREEYLAPDPGLVRAMVRHGLLREVSLTDPDHVFLEVSERGRRILGTGYLIDPLPEPSFLAPDAGQRRTLETD